MSIPIHNLYDFVNQVLEKRYIILAFKEWGNKDIRNLKFLMKRDISNEDEQRHHYILDSFDIDKKYLIARKIFPPEIIDADLANAFQPVVCCHDQEPLNYNLYSRHNIDESIIQLRTMNRIEETFYNRYPDCDYNLRFAFTDSLQKQWVLLHSELNSQELKKYEATGRYVGAYWWSHALISLDWYRFAEHDLLLKQQDNSKLFLLYCRDSSGARRYRKHFLHQCKSHNLLEQCLYHNNIDKSADLSAEYNPYDFANSKFSIVLETVFDQRIHLTEKTLRPIACGHPFLLAAGPGSLNLLKQYGFKTFSPWVDESYDSIQHPQQRLQAIVKEMYRLSSLDKQELDSIVYHCKEIAEYNKKHFFSKNFFNIVITELQTNVNNAIKSTNGLDIDFMFDRLQYRKVHDPDSCNTIEQQIRKHFVDFIKKGGTLEDYVPPDLD